MSRVRSESVGLVPDKAAWLTRNAQSVQLPLRLFELCSLMLKTERFPVTNTQVPAILKL